MLDKTLIPSHLIKPEARAELPIVPAIPPSRFRGFELLGKFFAWGMGILWLRVTGKLTALEYAQRFRKLLEELGGLWIKLGQLISLRVDMFSPELCSELSKLVDLASGFSPEQSARIIEAELGGPIDAFFEHFERVPFAAASIGQVHRGLLRKENIWVAIKVQRPYIAELYSRELGFMERVARMLARYRVLPVMRWEVLIWELRQIMEEEVDYRFEAESMRRMRKTLRKHKIYVPKVFFAYSTKRVLVSEFIHAVLMADYIKVSNEDPARVLIWCQENNIQPKGLARRLIFSLLRQVFEDNLYHADLHPGNIILLRDNRAALIDFGAVSFTEREYLKKFRFFVEALAKKDFARAADLVFLLSASLPPINLDPVKERMIRSLRTWATRAQVKGIPYHDKSIAAVTVEVIKILFEENCTAEWTFLRLRRALTTLDASLIYLYPGADYTILTKRYFMGAERRAVKQINPAQLITRGISGLNKTMEMMDQLEEYSLFHGAIMRRHATIFEGATSKFADLIARVFGEVAILALAIGAFGLTVFLHQRRPELVPEFIREHLVSILDYPPKYSNFGWAVFAFFDLYVALAFNKLRKRLGKKDVRLPENRVSV